MFQLGVAPRMTSLCYAWSEGGLWKVACEDAAALTTGQLVECVFDNLAGSDVYVARLVDSGREDAFSMEAPAQTDAFCFSSRLLARVLTVQLGQQCRTLRCKRYMLVCRNDAHPECVHRYWSVYVGNVTGREQKSTEVGAAGVVVTVYSHTVGGLYTEHRSQTILLLTGIACVQQRYRFIVHK